MYSVQEFERLGGWLEGGTISYPASRPLGLDFILSTYGVVICRLGYIRA